MVSDLEFHRDVHSASVVTAILQFGFDWCFNDDATLLTLASDDLGRKDENATIGEDFADALLANGDGDKTVALHRCGEDPLLVVVRDQARSVDGTAGLEPDSGVL